MSAATNAALKGAEHDATKAVDHVVDKVTRKKKPIPGGKVTKTQQARLNNLISDGGKVTKTQQARLNNLIPDGGKVTKTQQARLNNLISGSGITTIHVQRYK